jgi:hypothetical protein
MKEKNPFDIIEYVRLLKNIRGILLFNSIQRALDTQLISFLQRKHKYREIGIIPSLSTDRLGMAPFVRLFYPDENLNKFIKELSEGSEIPFSIWEGLVLASIFAAPLYIIEGEIFKQLLPITVFSLKVRTLPTSETLIRHIRIATYALIDAYELLTSETNRLVQQYLNEEIPFSRLKAHLVRRREVVEKDGRRRFWRLEMVFEGGFPIVAYFDLLLTFIERPSLFNFFKNSSFASLLLNPLIGILIYPTV